MTQQVSMKSDPRKSPPGPLSPLAFDIARPYETELANGLRVVIVENARLPLVSLRLAFMSGDINDPADARGLTSAMAHLLTEGTENYSSRQLAERIERFGAGLAASASDDFSIVSASALSPFRSDMM